MQIKALQNSCKPDLRTLQLPLNSFPPTCDQREVKHEMKRQTSFFVSLSCHIAHRAETHIDIDKVVPEGFAAAQMGDENQKAKRQQPAFLHHAINWLRALVRN
jgi:hypothetical protein